MSLIANLLESLAFRRFDLRMHTLAGYWSLRIESNSISRMLSPYVFHLNNAFLLINEHSVIWM